MLHQIKSHLRELLLHPLFLCLIVWLATIPFIPVTFSEYRVQHISDDFTLGPKWSTIYADLDSDGNSEKITLDVNDTAQTKILVFNNIGIIDEFNIRHQPIGLSNVFFADCNKDGKNEIFIFALNQDSIFLNIIDPLGARKIIKKDRFIDFRRKVLNSYDSPSINPIKVIVEGNGANFFFYISTGFSLHPRNIYRYSIPEDRLKKSQASGSPILNCDLSDINKDSIPELIINNHAAGNMHEHISYSDSCNWLMVMDTKLDFIFPPVPIGEYPSRIDVVPIKTDTSTVLAVYYNYLGSSGGTSKLYLYDIKGRKLSEKAVSDYENTYSHIMSSNDPLQRTLYYLKNRNAEVEELDVKFNTVNRFTIPEVATPVPIDRLDANSDGHDEYIFLDRNYSSLVIAQDNLRDAVTIRLEGYEGQPFISLIRAKGKEPFMNLQYNGRSCILKFERNPLYYFKYPFYLLIFLLYYSVIWIIARAQKYRLNLKIETERKIASLQMRAIKNQIDPHFTFNILNTIGSLYATEPDHDKADYIFAKYARLIRETVISSDKVIITVDEELQFVKNYLDLEKFRYSDAFTYRIDVGEGIDTNVKIPRMLIHTFVENAVKYNLRSGGSLSIIISKQKDKYLIEIEDTSLTEDKPQQAEGTGKGLTIVNELIELYFRLEKIRINYRIYDSEKIRHNQNSSGKLIIITIPN